MILPMLHAPATLNRHSSATWLAECERTFAGRTGQVEVDFAATRRIDAAGVAALLELRCFESAPAGRIRLVNVSPAIMQTLEIMGLHREFQFAMRPSDARSAGRPPILIVEDESIVRSVTGMVLAPLGHPILMAEDGAEAVAVAAGSRPGLIILDYLLPVYDGVEVLRRLKASEATRDIPVIVVSADARATGSEATFAGADFVFAKPFSTEPFRSRAARLLAEHALRQPQPACA
jgi:CheY-like chemotaxis protein/anti-anti-sigma regulatory factor